AQYQYARQDRDRIGKRLRRGHPRLPAAAAPAHWRPGASGPQVFACRRWESWALLPWTRALIVSGPGESGKKYRSCLWLSDNLGAMLWYSKACFRVRKHGTPPNPIRIFVMDPEPASSESLSL